MLGILGIACMLSSSVIDLDNLFNYNNQPVPNYIFKDNTFGINPITNEGATLGRVLFYDKRLSVNNTVSCASCHLQEFAFSDTAQISKGLHGELTGRHSMRLVNSRFAHEYRFFWDERAFSLESQTTQPIQDHIEMGFNGMDGNPGLDSLINRLAGINEYHQLFEMTYGDTQINEQRMQQALAQFIKSIQSFDSKFDEGLAQVNNNVNADFPNYTAQENLGKELFLRPPLGQNGGAGCQGCHRAPEFDIDPNSRNNGIIEEAKDPNTFDLTNTRAPSLRDLVNANGELNGPLMHNGALNSLMEVIEHYNEITFNPQVNNNLDRRLQGPPGSGGQNLNLSDEEKLALESFLLTLTGSDIYTNPMYSDPFEPNGTLNILSSQSASGCMDACAENYDVTATTDNGSCNYVIPAINSLPASTFVSNSIPLSGFPEGGVFSGSGVAFNVFNPSIAGVGLHTITYTINQGNNCEQSVSQNILAISVSFNFVNYMLNVVIPKLGISSNEHVPFQIFDLTGRVVESGILAEQNNFNHLQKGMYILNIKVGEQSYSHKLIPLKR